MAAVAEDASTTLPDPRVEWLTLPLELNTLWDFERQADDPAGDARFHGVTPAGAIWNLVVRYTRPGDIVLDPMAGSGTTVDVARREGRRVLAFDLAPTRPDIQAADARHLPLPDGFVDLCFIDSPYGDNVRYSDDPRCIGRLSAEDHTFYEGLDDVAREAFRVLRPGGVLGWVIADQYRRGHFTPVGFRLFHQLCCLFEPLDIVVLARHNGRTDNPMWEHRARTRGFLLRGFKYLFLVRKPEGEWDG